MKKKLLWTLAALAATPLSAGVVYVPLPGYETVGNFVVEPRILVSNQATNDWAYRPLLIAAEVPGIDVATVTDLVERARTEEPTGDATGASRALFRLLREAFTK